MMRMRLPSKLQYRLLTFTYKHGVEALTENTANKSRQDDAMPHHWQD